MRGAPRSYAKGREGVALVELQVSRLGWLFREQTVADFGIDGHVEIVRNDQATGRLLGVQVKCGRGYFREEHDDCFVHRGEPDDLGYWRNHSLPVLLVLADADQERCYWQVINDETVEETGKGWKVRVPKTQLLDGESAGRLDDLANGRPDVLRLRRLQADRDLIERLARGEGIVLRITEWVNKSSGRGDFELILDENGSESVLSEWTSPGRNCRSMRMSTRTTPRRHGTEVEESGIRKTAATSCTG